MVNAATGAMMVWPPSDERQNTQIKASEMTYPWIDATSGHFARASFSALCAINRVLLRWCQVEKMKRSTGKGPLRAAAEIVLLEHMSPDFSYYSRMGPILPLTAWHTPSTATPIIWQQQIHLISSIPLPCEMLTTKPLYTTQQAASLQPPIYAAQYKPPPISPCP